MEVYLSADVQDEYISKLKEQKTLSTIFTINGFQIRGFIKDYDEISILIENDGKEQLVYKHAISTIAPFQRGDDHRQSRPFSNRPYRSYDQQRDQQHDQQ